MPTESPVFDLSDKTILVTGANSGIGLETTRALAAMGARIVMACRSAERAEAATADVRKGLPNARLESMSLDLGSLRAIRDFAPAFADRYPKLDVLINNAGCFSMKRQETVDGFEQTFGVNHLGTFLLTNLLLPCLQATPGSRIVTLASAAHYHGKLDLDDAHIRQRYSSFPAYATSKLANVAFSLELAQRLGADGPTSNAVHPGHVATNIWPGDGWFARAFSAVNRLFATTPEQGAEPSVLLASDTSLDGVTGRYYDRLEPKEPAPLAKDPEFRAQLWQRSAELVGLA